MSLLLDVFAEFRKLYFVQRTPVVRAAVSSNVSRDGRGRGPTMAATIALVIIMAAIVASKAIS